MSEEERIDRFIPKETERNSCSCQYLGYDGYRYCQYGLYGSDILCNNINCPLERAPRPEKEIRQIYRTLDFNRDAISVLQYAFPYLSEEKKEKE